MLPIALHIEGPCSGGAQMRLQFGQSHFASSAFRLNLALRLPRTKHLDEAFDPPPVDPVGVEAIGPISNGPTTWVTIGTGILVLATVDPATGWFESIVVTTQGWFVDPPLARLAGRDGF